MMEMSSANPDGNIPNQKIIWIHVPIRSVMATMVAKTEFAALRIIVLVKLDGKVQNFYILFYFYVKNCQIFIPF